MRTAPLAVSGTDESRFSTTNINPGLLVTGTNLLAVEVHQQSTTSSDVSFDLELDAVAFTTPPAISLRSDGGQFALVWPAWATSAIAEASTNLDGGWIALTNAIVVGNGELRMTLPGPTNADRFFRLRFPAR